MKIKKKYMLFYLNAPTAIFQHIVAVLILTVWKALNINYERHLIKWPTKLLKHMNYLQETQITSSLHWIYCDNFVNAPYYCTKFCL